MGTPIRLILLLVLIGAVILVFRRWTREKPISVDRTTAPEPDRASEPAATEPQPEPLDHAPESRSQTGQADYGA